MNSPSESPEPEVHTERDRITRIRVLRSCIACRTRHVKCDRTRPCGGCTKNNIQCVFPEQPRRPPRARHPDAALLGRLQRLEGLIEQISQGRDIGPGTMPTVEIGKAKIPLYTLRCEEKPPTEAPGHLLSHEGRTKYVGQEYWGAISDEVENLRCLVLDGEGDADGDADQDPSAPSLSFFGSLATIPGGLTWYHPTKEEATFLVQRYFLAVHPLVPLIHRPSFEKSWLGFTTQHYHGGPRRTMPSFECVIFAVYFAAITSLRPDSIAERYNGMSKTDLRTHYRNALQQALDQNDFIRTEDLVMVQALTLFITCLRADNELKEASAFLGITARIAKNLGLHRDSNHFPKMKPIEKEVRRRVWYEICLQDLRTAEDLGSQPSIHPTSYDTRFPTNINDADIRDDVDPRHIAPSPGWTELTFFLIRCETLDCIRGLAGADLPLLKKKCRHKLEAVSHLRHHVMNKYCSNIDKSEPLQASGAIVAELLVSRCMHLVYHPIRHSQYAYLLTEEVRDKTFLHAIENLEAIHILTNQPNSTHWNWFFLGLHQAHALALLFVELAERTPQSENVERAWKAVESYLRPDDEYGINNGNPRLWSPLNKLKQLALANRYKHSQPRSQSGSGTDMEGDAEVGGSSGYTTSGSLGDGDQFMDFPPLPVELQNEGSGLEIADSPISWVEWGQLVGDFNLPLMYDPATQKPLRPEGEF